MLHPGTRTYDIITTSLSCSGFRCAESFDGVWLVSVPSSALAQLRSEVLHDTKLGKANIGEISTHRNLAGLAHHLRPHEVISL